MFTTLPESGTARHSAPHAIAGSALIHAMVVAGVIIVTTTTAARTPTVVYRGERVRVLRLSMSPNIDAGSLIARGAIDRLGRWSRRLRSALGEANAIPPIPEIPIAPAIDESEYEGYGPVLDSIDIATLEHASKDFVQTQSAGDIIIGEHRPHVADWSHGQLALNGAMPVDGNPVPEYPRRLLTMGIEGTVEVEFMLDTTGTVDASSLRVVRSAHDLFTDAVRRALPKMRYVPAIVGGAKIRVLVRQPFTFVLDDRRFGR